MRALVIVLVLGACYGPATERACEVACIANGPCPNGLLCGADNLCRLPDGTCPGQADGGVDPDAATTCFGSANGLIRPCIPLPTDAQIFVDPMIDTSMDPRCLTVAQTDGSNVCVIAATSILVSAVVAVVGARPLVLVSTGDLDVMGTLDAASHRSSGQRGAGSSITACGNATAPGDAGGGAGGSFQRQGGDGGDSNGQGSGIALGPITNVASVRGGCPGQAGNNQAGLARGEGGASGGAIYLIATNRISIAGKLDASGQGGQGGAVVSGGGGGGSGGLIGLDAPFLDVFAGARIVANGGGGGEGGASGELGGDGGESPTFDVAGPGGISMMGGTAGGDGANGAVSTQTGGTGQSTAQTFGAGGGGGGVGYIFIFGAPNPGGAISPPPILN